MHKFKERLNPHEYFYSEILLFRPWFDESEIYAESLEKCKNLYDECVSNVMLEEGSLVLTGEKRTVSSSVKCRRGKGDG